MSQKNPIETYAAHVCEPEHVWDPEKYVSNCSLTGEAFGVSVAITFQYCLGSSYLKGYVGNHHLEIFRCSNQNYQIYMWRMGSCEDVHRKNISPVTFSGKIRDEADSMVAFIEKLYRTKSKGIPSK